MEHPVLPAAVRGQCWEHGLLKELAGAIEPDGSQRRRDPGGWRLGLRVESSRVKFGDHARSSWTESDPGLKITWGIFFKGSV
jgi:hypothetical protein